MVEKKYLPRKNEKLMITGTVLTALVTILSIIIIVGGWSRWTKAQEKDVQANALLSSNNKVHIEYLEKCELENRTKGGSIDANLKNISEAVKDIKQQQKEIMNMLFKIVQNGNRDKFGKTN
jgi:hypothetical protein